jgi:hypothetical protein
MVATHVSIRCQRLAAGDRTASRSREHFVDAAARTSVVPITKNRIRGRAARVTRRLRARSRPRLGQVAVGGDGEATPSRRILWVRASDDDYTRLSPYMAMNTVP